MMSSGITNVIGDFEADVVVIGGGTAGLPAALAAVEKGAKKVIVIEKRISLGGNGLRASGIFAAESPLKNIRGTGAAPRDELFKKAMKWHHWDKVDPRIVRSFIDRSGDTIEWLINNGVEFKPGTPTTFHPGQPPTWHVPRSLIAGVVKTLTDNCREKGVKLLVRTSCVKILKGSEGNITGVTAVKEGKEFKIKAGSVIIATGGFAGNKALLKKYFPWYHDNIRNHGVPNTGDGIMMASEIGADVDDFATMMKEGPMVPGLNLFSNISRLVRDPFIVWVNKNGKRFIDESTGLNIFESVNSMLLQPDMLSYALSDENINTLIETKWKNYKGPIPIKKKESGLQSDLHKQAESHNRVKISDSWDEIAGWIGADAGNLKETVDKYNYFCDHGRDEIFAKNHEYLVPLRKAPYYAVRTTPNILDTIGGIKINEYMEVLDKEHEPIHGLYAAGVTTSGWQSHNYCIELAGSAVGFAITSGRIAGEKAVEWLLADRI